MTGTMHQQWDSEPASDGHNRRTGFFNLKPGARVEDLMDQHSKQHGHVLAAVGGGSPASHGKINFKDSGEGFSFGTDLQDSRIQQQSPSPKGPVWVKSTTVGGKVDAKSPHKGRDSLCPYTGALPISSISFAPRDTTTPVPKPHKMIPLEHNQPVDLFYDMNVMGGAGIPATTMEGGATNGVVNGSYAIPSRDFHTAQSLAFETPESLQACRNRDSMMMERDDLDEEAQRKKQTGWKKMKQKLWARVAPQCFRPDLPPNFLTAADATRMTSMRRMESIKNSKAQHEEDVFSAATSVKGYSRRQRYLVDKIEQSIT